MDEKDLIPLIRKEEKKRAYEMLSQRVLSEGKIPPMPYLLLREMGYPIKLILGSVMGVFLGVTSLVITFILFVYIMHMEF